MKTVSAYYTQALFRYAKQRGVAIGRGTSNMDDPAEARVKLDQQDITWQYLQNNLGDTLGVDFGLQLQPADMGTFGHLLMSVNSLEEACEQLQKFYPLIGEGGLLNIDCAPQTVTVEYVPHYQVAKEVRVEAVIASILSIMQHIVEEPLTPQSIGFEYMPSEEVIEQFKQIATNTLIHAGGKNQVKFSAAELYRPLKHANPVVAKSILTILNTELDALSSMTAVEKVQGLLTAQPYLSRAQVAERMHVSQRTLTRLMRQENKVFKQMKQDAMQGFAEHHLSQNKRVNEVAEMLHYSDASAFIKAYKQWTGRTPNQTDTKQ